MTKQEVLREIADEWQQFLELAHGFSHEEQLLPGAVGHWSVRDVFIHIAAWDEELVKIIEKYRSTGEETDYGEGEAVDKLNEAQVEEKRTLSLVQLGEHLHDAHHRLLVFLDHLSAEAFDPHSYTGEWIAIDSGGHYREHRMDIERWKALR